ncbi:ribosomal protein S18 acetylase RimI-like enzyme [Streptomyces aurantiacus]|uniref:GNAT family N-acetyltransferase n=1 Tax=Streptomyces aurantiacus TaxID=47760 RepID=UPI0027939885|nr:GNAT family N-acetyltransferase [Streptomyces aurantiacus]MDQ0773407.1 ribosomal protein S18 acetylase RimI-like enzyme [Streptomyces aurantiacus]
MDDDHSPAPVHIREMTLADCPRVAEIRVRGWQNAYKGLMPQSYLDGLDVAAELPRRRAHFTQAGEGVVNLVAQWAGEVVGWSCHGPYREGERRTGDAELYAIYVAPDRIARGVGRALLRNSVARSAAAGHERMLLWVLRENAGARRFYEGAGFVVDGAEEPFEVEGVEVPEVRYVRLLGGTGGS